MTSHTPMSLQPFRLTQGGLRRRNTHRATPALFERNLARKFTNEKPTAVLRPCCGDCSRLNRKARYKEFVVTLWSEGQVEGQGGAVPLGLMCCARTNVLRQDSRQPGNERFKSC